jgi:hypothetical protein
MLGLAVAGLYCASVKRPLLGILLVTASIAVKPITLIALPFVGLLWAGSTAGWGRKILCWLATAGLALGLLGLAGLVNGLGFGWVGALDTPGAVWMWFAPVGLTGALLSAATDFFGGPGAAVAGVVSLIGKAVAVGLVLLLVLRPVRNAFGTTVLRRTAWAFAAVVLLAPVIQPWYMVWLLVLFGIAGIPDGWQLRTVMYLTAFFTLISLTDQLSVFQWIPIAIVRAVAIAVGVSFALYLIFFDKKTKVFFRHREGYLPGAAQWSGFARRVRRLGRR